MKRRRGGDASFLIGLMLGIAVGAAIAIILAPQSGEETRAQLSEDVEEARKSLQSKVADTKNRLEGAAEGAAD